MRSCKQYATQSSQRPIMLFTDAKDCFPTRVHLYTGGTHEVHMALMLWLEGSYDDDTKCTGCTPPAHPHCCPASASLPTHTPSPLSWISAGTACPLQAGNISNRLFQHTHTHTHMHKLECGTLPQTQAVLQALACGHPAEQRHELRAVEELRLLRGVLLVL